MDSPESKFHLKDSGDLLGPCFHHLGSLTVEASVDGFAEACQPVIEMTLGQTCEAGMRIERTPVVFTCGEHDRRPESDHDRKMPRPFQTREIVPDDRILLHVTVKGMHNRADVVGCLDVWHLAVDVCLDFTIFLEPQGSSIYARKPVQFSALVRSVPLRSSHAGYHSACRTAEPRSKPRVRRQCWDHAVYLETLKKRTHRTFRVTRRFRLVKAYAVTAWVLLSYGMHALLSWLGAKRWAASRRRALHRKNARRVVRMILSLQGLFIKVGQLISILTNFLPEDFRVELEGLQDRIPARPLTEIRTRIRSEFGADPEDLFASFENEPVASASLAQVHEGRLHDGRRVAVKVQHLNIEEVARLDLRTIRRILGIVSRIVGVRGLDRAYSQLESVILEELDFAAEGRNLSQVAKNFDGYEGVGFPEVVPDRSTSRVLTTTYVEGVKVTDLEGLRQYGVDRRKLAERVVRAYAQMIFVDGFYHADPHPGNVIVRPNGDIVFIDFGAVAGLSPEMKDGIPRLLMGIVLRDRDRIGSAFRQMGIVAQEGHQRTLDELVDHLQKHFFDELSQDSFALQDVNLRSMMEAKMEALPDFLQRGMSVRDLTETFQVPRDWILLERTSLLLLGLCTHLDPTMNPFKTLRPYLERIVFGIEDDWVAVITNVFTDVAVGVVGVFQEINRFVRRLNA